MPLWKPDFDRVLTVLRRQGEPDRVPFLELFHDLEVIEAAMGQKAPQDPAQQRQFHLDFMIQHGYDYVVGRYVYGFPGCDALIADDTAFYSRGQRGWQDEHHGPITSWAEFESYQWPDPSSADFTELEAYAQILPDGMRCVSLLPGGVLENLISLMGLENLCIAAVEQPNLVQTVVDRVGDCLCGIYEALGDMDWVGALWLNDDMGFKTQTILSPAMLRRFIFPHQTRLVEIAHAHGKPVMLHACDNVLEVMDDLIEGVGVDAKHSFEDIIQSVTDFKRQYGDRVAALGGIDVDILARGTEAQVRAYTRQRIEECAPGGGWALGSGNSVANYVPLGNFLAMLDAGRQWGVY